MSGEIIGKYQINGLLEYLLYFENVKNFDELPVPIQSHLKKYKDDLENRATVKNEGRIWWRYSRPMHKEFYNLKKSGAPIVLRKIFFATMTLANTSA